jgi:two-component system, OmpR family, alkaline phosphatase synthesis response regulator PhoP
MGIGNSKNVQGTIRMPRRILIVEDDKDIAHLVELHLKDAGYEVSLAHDGNAGLDLALSKPCDLIILGLMLPGWRGWRSVGA